MLCRYGLCHTVAAFAYEIYPVLCRYGLCHTVAAFAYEIYPVLCRYGLCHTVAALLMRYTLCCVDMGCVIL